MPKKLVTKYDSRELKTRFTAENAAAALAEAIGGTVKNNGSSEEVSVSLAPLGYSDLEFKLFNFPEGSGPALVNVDFRSTSNPDVQIRTSRWNVRGRSTPVNNAVSCYVARDPNNDAVVIGLHPGKEEKAEYDDVENNIIESYICMFAGRDANNDVIWGFGHNHINEITNGRKRISFEYITPSSTNTRPTDRIINLSEIGGPTDLFHFVKMRNYLSEGYPEMKTAYVSLVRSDLVPKIVDARSNISYYASGSLFGYGGTNYEGESEYGGQGFYPAIDPFVKF